MRWFLVAAALLAAGEARAYCVQNQLSDRSLGVVQEQHPDSLREQRRLRATIPPGGKECCEFHNLDCNPRGRNNSIVKLAVTIPGEPEYQCGYPQGAEPMVKVTGAGTVRVVRNPNTKSAYPYIVRVRTHDRQELTGPKGLVCPPAKGKQ